MTTHQGTSATSSGTGIGFTGLLTLLLIALKLLDVTVVASWSWWAVLSPIWITAGFVIVGLFILGFCAIVAASVKA